MLLTYGIIESEKERMVLKMKEYTKKPKLSRKTINRLMYGETVKKGTYEYTVEQQWNEELGRREEILLRWNNAKKDYKCWVIGAKGLYEFEIDRND